MSINFKEKLYTKKPTPRSKLRKLEQAVLDQNLQSIEALVSWMITQGFTHYPIINNLVGSPEDSNIQMYKPRGKNSGKHRWHWRLYDYFDKILITSELEDDPIGNEKNLLESISRHVIKDTIVPHLNAKYGTKLPTHIKNTLQLVKFKENRRT